MHMYTASSSFSFFSTCLLSASATPVQVCCRHAQLVHERNKVLGSCPSCPCVNLSSFSLFWCAEPKCSVTSFFHMWTYFPCQSGKERSGLRAVPAAYHLLLFQTQADTTVVRKTRGSVMQTLPLISGVSQALENVSPVLWLQLHQPVPSTVPSLGVVTLPCSPSTGTQRTLQ